ncbi:class I adenylate-forming enzyme family protein [Prescottella agglutinans]|uniref:Acyl-CoA synthetase (AMP-forming)/AMP-acid ligase II n=1 Tax=Prescottella agglutinans TaxID=1644129 RepID=A0ABT6M7J8_9NOCA|nr:class I adenylate-forming enzyme family protein [Prescottella agglutinans]MDH6280253.1 acyl-CoA synthetase (AMP-forming)/AMP-acid ligase II [Prescottella agglutinans]
MSDPSRAQDPRAEAVARLTAPGAEFEIVEEPVRGAPMRVFRNRYRSLHRILTESARYGDTEYLVCGDLRLSFTEHLDRVASLSHAMRTRYGIGKGDRVAILSANNAEWIMTFWAATALGAVTVGMNSMWSAREIEYGVELSGPSLIVADAPRRELLGAVDVPVLTVEDDIPALSTAHPGAELPDPDVNEDDPAVILFTSGTTGRPKGATHSQRNMIAAVDFHRFNDALATELGRAPSGRRFLLATPLFHIAALHNLAVPRLAFGDTGVITTGRFDIDRVLRLIERERVTNWGAVPTMVSRIVEHGDLSGYDLSSLQTISVSSAPSSAALKERLRKILPVAGRSLGTTYGLTESSSAATLATAADLAERPDTVGTAVPTMSVEVRDEHGNVVPDGVEGEICIRGPLVMLGYWNNEEATAASIDEYGWMRTGDLGTLESGYLRISSRRSDLILRGGENVYPAEVENVLTEHPAVRECIVLGVEHPDLGEEVCAVVVVDADDAVTSEALSSFMQERIARYKVPTRWTLTTTELPRNATGKVKRQEVVLAPRADS